MHKKSVVFCILLLVVVLASVLAILYCKKCTNDPEHFIKQPKIAIYSGNFGNYRNELASGIDDGYFDPSIDYYFYTDHHIDSKKWKVIVIENDLTPKGGADVMDKHRWANKHVKFILPDELKKYDIVVWKDTKIFPLNVKYDNIVKLFTQYPDKSVFLQTHFSDRTTIADELKKTIELGIENKITGTKFLKKCAHFTSPLKLSDLCNFARTTDKHTNEAFKHVFDTLKKYKLKRDQNVFIWAIHEKRYPIDRIENLKIEYGKMGDESIKEEFYDPYSKSDQKNWRAQYPIDQYNLGDIMNMPYLRDVPPDWKDYALLGGPEILKDIVNKFPDSIFAKYYELSNRKGLNIMKRPDFALLEQILGTYQNPIANYGNQTLVIHLRLGDFGRLMQTYKDRILDVVKKMNPTTIIILCGLHKNRAHKNKDVQKNTKIDINSILKMVKPFAVNVIHKENAADEDLVTMYYAPNLLVHTGGFSALGAHVCKGNVFLSTEYQHTKATKKYRVEVPI